MENLINCFHNRPIIALGRTRYLINPLTDHDPETPFELVDDAIQELSALVNFNKVDKVVCEEDRGGFIGSIIAWKEKKSLAMVKWNPSGLEGQNEIKFRNAYAEGKMYLYGVKKGDKIVLIEDLIDSGNTIISMIKLLRQIDVEIIDVICIAEKIDLNGAEKIEKETGIIIKSLLKFTTKGARSRVVEVNGIKYIEK